MEHNTKIDLISIELRYLRERSISFQTVRVRRGTDISDFLDLISADFLMKNSCMPFSRDIRTISSPLYSGELESGTYTVYGISNLDWISLPCVTGKINSYQLKGGERK